MADNGAKLATDLSSLDTKYVYEQMSQALMLFNQIFVDISQTSAGKIAARREEIEIHNYNLSGPQNNAITQLHGFLCSVQGHAQAVRMKGVHENSRLKSIPITFPSPSDNIEPLVLVQRKAHLLQEFLVRELNKNEELDAVVKRLEKELLAYQEQDKTLKSGRSSVFKEPPSISAPTGLTQRQQELKLKAEAAALNVEPEPEENPRYYFGHYVRKAFDNGKKYFGLIVGFDEYFRIQYSDGDEEDEEATDLKKILWKGNVPTSDMDSCERHALLKGYSLNFNEVGETVSDVKEEQKSEVTSQQSPLKNGQLLAHSASEPHDVVAVGSGTTSSEADENDNPPIDLFATADGVMMANESILSHPPPPRQPASIDLKPSSPPERKRSVGAMLQKDTNSQQQQQQPRSVEQQGSAKKRIRVDLSQS